MNVADDKTIVREYFNSTGFDRWRRIYGDGEVNKVQLDIRTGHQQTVATVLSWLRADENLGISVCDAGCGVGSLSILLQLVPKSMPVISLKRWWEKRRIKPRQS